MLRARSLFVLVLAAPALAAQDPTPSTPASDPLAALAAGLPPAVRAAADNLQRPWECDLAFRLVARGEGVEGSGHLRWFHPRVFAARLKLQEVGDEGRQADLDLLADDDYLFLGWQAEDQRLAARIELDFFAEIRSALATLLAAGPAEDFAEHLAGLEFTESRRDSGRVRRLEADLAGLLDAPSGPERVGLRLDFAADSGFPLAAELDAGSEGLFTFAVSGLRFPDEIDPETFTWTGPPALDFTVQARQTLRELLPEADEEF
ncbi:MAG: hypothetical protein D6702_12910 [Planctomycetota bacterium]|nr:MAG: hypothetical protein D6702_12910 [Planctomycetota bacterium]